MTIIVALALLAFIVGDLFKADGTFGSSRNNVGTIAGTDIPIQYYQAKVDENTEIYKQNTQQNSLETNVYDQIQDQTWEQLIRQYVIEEEYEKAGINVTADELYDMVQGNFVDPQVMQIPIFRDAETGQFDRNLVIQFLKNKDLDPSGQAAASWASFEKSLVQNKKDQKFLSLVDLCDASSKVGVSAVEPRLVSAGYPRLPSSCIDRLDRSGLSGGYRPVYEVSDAGG